MSQCWWCLWWFLDSFQRRKAPYRWPWYFLHSHSHKYTQCEHSRKNAQGREQANKLQWSMDSLPSGWSHPRIEGGSCNLPRCTTMWTDPTELCLFRPMALLLLKFNNFKTIILPSIRCKPEMRKSPAALGNVITVSCFSPFKQFPYISLHPLCGTFERFVCNMAFQDVGANGVRWATHTWTCLFDMRQCWSVCATTTKTASSAST